MAAYVGQTALTALWNKIVAVQAGKADKSSVYSKAEVDYKLATTYGVASGGSYDDTVVVHLAGAETITGAKTFSGNNTFSGSNTFSSTNTFSGTPSFTSGSIILQYSSTRKVTFSTASSQSKAYTLYVPPATATTARYLISRTAATTTDQLAAFADAIGTVKNSGYTVNTSITSSSTGIPTSAAVRSYVADNAGGGGMFKFLIDGYMHNGTLFTVLLNFDNMSSAPSSSTYKYYLMRYRRAHGKKKWSIPYLGIKYYTPNRLLEGICRWNISTTTPETQFWGGDYDWGDVFHMHQHQNAHLPTWNGGGFTHTFGCAIFEDTGSVITRVSNIAIFNLTNDGRITRKPTMF